MKRFFVYIFYSVLLMSCSKSIHKGDGAHFYSHTENGKITYHSTKECDLIGESYNIDEYKNVESYDFCSKCMDDSLIILCRLHLEEDNESTPTIKSPDELMPEEILDIEIEKYDKNTGLIELRVQNISPYEIEHSMIAIAYGGTTRYLSVNNIESGDALVAQKPIHPGFSVSDIHVSLFEIKFKNYKLKMCK